MNPHNYAIILAGGRGERFWPLSTAARPKQFISLFGGRPLIALALERLEGVVPPERTLIITAEDLLDATADVARQLPPENLIGEPVPRDTAAACALACGLVAARDPEGVAAILTADQLMSDIETFRQTLRDSFTAAAQGEHIVTIGIPPSYPRPASAISEWRGARVPYRHALQQGQTLRRKPDAQRAAQYVASGNYCWNAKHVHLACAHDAGGDRRACARTAGADRHSASAQSSADLQALLEVAYANLVKVSIDYAVMEKADNIIMAYGAFGWDDVGTWPAVAGHFAADEKNNVVIGSSESIDSGGNIVVSENRLTALIGVHDLVVIQSDNATLICPRERAQEVKQMVQRIARRPDAAKYL